MIWGNTHAERDAEEDARNRNWFAWYPVQLRDGRWLWLERVSRELVCGAYDGCCWVYDLLPGPVEEKP